jgi:hypothetical protein
METSGLQVEGVSGTEKRDDGHKASTQRLESVCPIYSITVPSGGHKDFKSRIYTPFPRPLLSLVF